jgi:hypothetical protein
MMDIFLEIVEHQEKLKEFVCKYGKKIPIREFNSTHHQD